MAKSIQRNRRVTPEEAARLREARAEFAAHPSRSELLASGQYVGPMSLEEYLAWRSGAGQVSLARQLRAAIAATGQPLSAVAQASGVPETVLEEFVHTQRNITLETADKLAAYLGLALLPVARPS